LSPGGAYDSGGRARSTTLAVLLAAAACNGKFEFDVPSRGGEGGGSSGGTMAAVAGTTDSGGAGASAIAGSSGATNEAGQIGSGGVAGATPSDNCGSLPRCPPGLHCAEGECVECALDGNCSSSAKRCDPDRQRCVACLTEDDCEAGFACDSLANRCLRKCDAGLSCPPDLHGCDEGRGVCYECDEDRECANAATGKLCASDGSGCVECRSDDDCENEHCDPLSGRCVTCRDGRDCATGLCDPVLHICLPN
jgi:hypothetical protein